MTTSGNKQVNLKVDRIKKWVMHGAEPSERVAKLLDIAEILPPAPRRGLPKPPPLLELVRSDPGAGGDGSNVEGGDDASSVSGDSESESSVSS